MGRLNTAKELTDCLGVNEYFRHHASNRKGMLVPTRKKVSLLVPLYNSSGHLDRIASDISNQTTPFDEVLMYDDCSTDNCVEKATRLGFKVIRGSTNKRQSAARNILLRNSTGNMVHFHDHDDPIHPRFVEQMLVHAGRDSVVICNFERIDKKTILHTFGSDYLQNPYRLVFDGYVHLNAMIACRDLALRSGGFDEMLTLSEEKDFLFKLLRAGARVVLLPETLATWKVQDTSFMCAQGWPAAAIMTRRFIANCTSVVETPIVPQMLEYCLRFAWDCYYADDSTLSELRLLFRDLSAKGHKPRDGLGKKMRWACTVLGPVNSLRLRRALSLKRT